MAAAEIRAAEGGRSPLAAAQALDMTDWLPHDLLLKLDRCMMAHAVEGRTPFLDSGVMAAAFRLPDAHEAAARDRANGFFRKWLEKNQPAARPFAPKSGFTVPVGEWIKAQGSRARPAGRRATRRGRDRPPREGGGAVRRHPPLAARFCLLEAAVLRAVAPAAHPGPAAVRGCLGNAGRRGNFSLTPFPDTA